MRRCVRCNGAFQITGIPLHTFRRFKRSRRSDRSGALLVETAIVMSVFIVLTLGAIDLHIGVYRSNMLAQAARHGVRQMIVHGALAAPAMTSWGPASYSGTAGDGSPYADAVRPMLAGIPPNNVAINVDWLDGDNAVGGRVRCTLSTPYQPILGVFVGYPTLNLKATSTMPIAH